MVPHFVWPLPYIYSPSANRSRQRTTNALGEARPWMQRGRQFGLLLQIWEPRLTFLVEDKSPFFSSIRQICKRLGDLFTFGPQTPGIITTKKSPGSNFSNVCEWVCERSQICQYIFCTYSLKPSLANASRNWPQAWYGKEIGTHDAWNHLLFFGPLTPLMDSGSQLRRIPVSPEDTDAGRRALDSYICHGSCGYLFSRYMISSTVRLIGYLWQTRGLPARASFSDRMCMASGKKNFSRERFQDRFIDKAFLHDPFCNLSESQRWICSYIRGCKDRCHDDAFCFGIPSGIRPTTSARMRDDHRTWGTTVFLTPKFFLWTPACSYGMTKNLEFHFFSERRKNDHWKKLKEISREMIAKMRPILFSQPLGTWWNQYPLLCSQRVLYVPHQKSSSTVSGFGQQLDSLSPSPTRLPPGMLWFLVRMDSIYSVQTFPVLFPVKCANKRPFHRNTRNRRRKHFSQPCRICSGMGCFSVGKFVPVTEEWGWSKKKEAELNLI